MNQGAPGYPIRTGRPLSVVRRRGTCSDKTPKVENVVRLCGRRRGEGGGDRACKHWATLDPPSGCPVSGVRNKKKYLHGALPATAPPTQSTLDEPTAGKHKSHPAPRYTSSSFLVDHDTPLHVFFSHFRLQVYSYCHHPVKGFQKTNLLYIPVLFGSSAIVSKRIH